MNDSQISVRYAKALFKSAIEQDLIDGIYQEMLIILDACKIQEFVYLLETPAVSGEQKCNIAMEILKGKISKLTGTLIKLVMSNKREMYLPGIARHYKALYKKHKGIKSASLVTAFAIDDKTKENLIQLIKQAMNAEIEMSSEVDETVLGGFILTIEDQQYDASIATSLKKIKKQLLDTSVIKN